MIQDENEILHWFGYDEKAQKLFPFTEKYMAKIGPHLTEVLNDAKARERFMLAGLYLTYFAFIHFGESMSTEIDESKLIPEAANNLHVQRLKIYKRITGKQIANTHHYLNLIHLNLIKQLILRPENMLYQFVLYDR